MYPPPRLRGGRLIRQPPSLGNPFFSVSRGFPREIPLSTSSLERHRLSGTASRGLPLGTVSGTLSGLPLGSLSGQTLREEFWILGARPPSAQFSRSSLHDFFSPLFFASLKSRSETPLFRAWHRKTSQNGGQNRPKSSPLGVRNRCYVARAEM